MIIKILEKFKKDMWKCHSGILSYIRNNIARMKHGKTNQVGNRCKILREKVPQNDGRPERIW